MDRAPGPGTPVARPERRTARDDREIVPGSRALPAGPCPGSTYFAAASPSRIAVRIRLAETE